MILPSASTEPSLSDRAGVFDGPTSISHRSATAAETALNAAARTSRLHDRSAELERQNDRLAEFASVVSRPPEPAERGAGRVQLARDEVGQ